MCGYIVCYRRFLETKNVKEEKENMFKYLNIHAYRVLRRSF